MFSENYDYAERPAALILGRRGFLKVVGLCVGAVAVCGYAIDDKLCQAMGLTSSHQNPTVMQIYKDLGAKPTDHTMHELLHTHYYPRTMLASMTEAHHG